MHQSHLIGLRNRLIVLINWAWDYFFFERGVRLILTNPALRPHEDEPSFSRVKD